MKSLFEGMKTAALFVGAVVGAGFATGQEVQLFFGDGGVGNLVIASLFMSICAFVFLELGGRKVTKDPRIELVSDCVISLSSFAVYTAMIAAAEGVLFEMTGVSDLSILLAVILLFITSKKIGWVSGLNLVAVPVMAVIIVIVGMRTQGSFQGEIHLVRSLAYGGMNILFSGALMMREGERLSRRERVIAAIVSGVVIFLLLFFMYRSIGGTTRPEMPFLEAANAAGMGIFAPLTLLLAILTTMASCGYLATERFSALIGDKALAASLIVIVGVLISQWGFSAIVRTTYPLVSYCGLAASLLALFVGGAFLFHRAKS